MKKYAGNVIQAVLAICLLALAVGCSSGGSTSQESLTGSTGQGTGAIVAKLDWGATAKAAIKAASSAPAGVVTVRITITGPGINPALQKDFAVADGSGTMDGVPAGTDRTLTVQGLDGSGTVAYQGTAANLTVQAGQTTDAGTITMNAAVAAAFMELAGDGSFEQGFAQWTPVGTSYGVQYTLVSDAVHGSKAVRVTNRMQSTDAPRQNLLPATLANISGIPFTSRFRIKLDAPGMARCVMNLTSTLADGRSVTQKLILAEQVVRTANAWVEVSGTVTLTWDGTLGGANIVFDVSQPAEQVYPAFTLDHLRVQRDSDADGLPDLDETVAGTLTADRDDDGLPDGWESDYFKVGLLDPEVADAGLDADGDGFSNHEEFWAATDPLDPASKPGVPCTAGATAKVQAITRYLALLPSLSTNRVLSGQHITGVPAYGGLSGEFASNVQALFTKTGKWPGILSMQYEGADATIGPLQTGLVNPLAIDWAAQGGLLIIKYQPFDPWTLAISSPSGGSHVDLVGLLNPAAGNPANLAANQLANTRWLDWLDQIATGLDQLQQSGVTVLWRPLSEMNNGSHWHSRQPREAWIALWRHMHNYLSNTRGLKNLVWAYESDGTAHAVVPADYYYPGNDVIDFMGHNLYDDDWALGYDLNAIFRRYPKIYGFPQAGSASVRDGSWDNLTMINGIRERFPRASLFCAWNDFYAGGGVLQLRSIVSQSNASALLNDPWVITRDEIH